MKLLRNDMSLEEVHGDQRQYAILSHTWGREITYDDLCYHQNRQSAHALHAHEGYSKIANFLKTASDDGFDYFWADTCCIDKRNSSELNEAINSMFNWYRNAGICYIYLEDFEWTESEKLHMKWDDNASHGNKQWIIRFGQCRWFSRVWTLQELLAPQKIEFLDKNWTKFSPLVCEDILHCAIEARTNIPAAILRRKKSLQDINIATRMCWAAGRKATRPEDVAYSLLGVFGVNLSLIYGEGREQAFVRLQKKIIDNGADDSVLAWSGTGDCLGLLAQSPDQFQNCSSMKAVSSLAKTPWTFSNVGLQVSLPMTKVNKSHPNQYTVYLNCVDPDSGYCPSFQLIKIAQQGYARTGNLDAERFPLSEVTAMNRKVFVSQNPKCSAPQVKFDCSHISKCLVGWDAWVPSKDSWVIEDNYTICERPVLNSDKYSYTARLRLRDRGISDNAYFITVSIDSDDKGGWKCTPRIHKEGSIWKKPSEHVTRYDSELDTLTHKWWTSRGYDIKVTVPRWVRWYEEDPLLVRVSVKGRDEPDTDDGHTSLRTANPQEADLEWGSPNVRAKDHDCTVKNFRRCMSGTSARQVHSLRDIIMAKYALQKVLNVQNSKENETGLHRSKDDTGMPQGHDGRRDMQDNEKLEQADVVDEKETGENGRNDDWELVDIAEL